jgi:ceramide glucosyltransferase
MYAFSVTVLVVYFSLIVIRAIMIFACYIKTKRDFTPDYDEGDFTVVQPIVSGDPNLEADLKANLEQTKTMRFIWVIDKSDALADEISTRIRDSDEALKGRISVIKAGDYRKDKSAKAYKQGLAKNIQTKYSIFIDDDTIIDFGRLLIPQDKSLEDGRTVISGLPHS